jgi:glycerophosphoryl diester phosphodiesterase
MKYITGFIILLSVFLTGAYVPNAVPTPRHKFMVIAHRGDHVIYPENTLKAYAQAINNGADYVEIDLRTTKDGQLISMHDATLNRMTNGTGAVKDITLDAIGKLHVKTKDSTAQAVFAVPTFKQILELCKNKIYIYIDFKEADPAVVYLMLKQYGMENQVLVYINKPEQFTAWRKTAPKMPLMLSLPNNIKDEVAMKQFIDQYQPDILDGDYRQYTPQMLALSQSYNLPVWPDGQSAAEGPTEWDDALARGLKGLQTDHPLAFINYLLQKGVR